MSERLPSECPACPRCDRRVGEWLPGEHLVFTGFWIPDSTKGPDVDVPEWDKCHREECPSRA